MSSLQFIIGPAAEDHERVLIQRLNHDMQEHPHDQFFYLVPNHIKFSTEIRVLKSLRELNHAKDVYAQSRLQILSFSRLAWLFLRDQPQYQHPRISQVGMTMLVAKIVANMSVDDLRLFAKEAHQAGFVQDLTQQLIEFSNGNIDPHATDEIMQKLLQSTDENQDTADKIKMLFQVYDQFDQALAGRMNTATTYELLTKILDQQDFSHTHFYLDHFTSEFSAKEEALVEAMIQNGASTLISLILDKPEMAKQPADTGLYTMTANQYSRLRSFANQHSVALLADISAGPLRTSKDISVVEQWMAKMTRLDEPQPMPAGQTVQHVHFFTAPTRFDELSRVAAKIRQMVANENYRYRDFLILTRHLDGYETIMEPIFQMNDVPIFNDNDRSMVDAPLVTLLDALFKIVDRDYQLEDILQLLKTGLLIPTGVNRTDFANAVYLTENWCLKYSRTKKDWLTKAEWSYDPLFQADMAANPTKESQRAEQRQAQLSAQLNLVHDYVRDQVAPLVEQLKDAQTGKMGATVLYQGLSQLNVQDQLKYWANRSSAAGDLNQAQEPQQAWHTFCNLLDEYVTIMGDDQFELESFQNLLTVGFQTATYSQIPSTMDQVLVSETGITQTDQRKVVFMIGSTDDVMPEFSVNNSLLSDDDRQLLQTCLGDNQYLAQVGLSRTHNEPLINCLGMLAAKKELFLSAPIGDGDEGALRPSPYMIGLARYCNQYNDQTQSFIHDLPMVPVAQSSFTQLKPFISSRTATLSSYVQVYRDVKNSTAKLGSAWRLVSEQLNQDQVARLRNLQYKNETTNLSKSMASLLYGEPDPLHPQDKTRDRHNTLNASISQLQTYFRNPYEYFLKYGLKLRKRDELEISNASSGTFYHDSMENFVKGIIQDNVLLADLSDQELVQRLQRATKWAFAQQPAIDELANNYRRIGYQKRYLQNVVITMGRVLRNQAQLSNAQPVHVELSFDQAREAKGAWAALRYPLQNGQQVFVRGRIDRLDQIPVAGDATYYNVVDYKSGNKVFDLVDAYNGLDLQMLTYLNSLQQHLVAIDANGKIGGALYLHLASPNYKYIDLQTGSLSDIELHNHLYHGVMMNDPQLLMGMDHGLTKGKQLLLDLSTKKNKGENKDQQPYTFKKKSGSLLVSPEELGELLRRNEQLLVNAATNIFAGDVALRPFHRDKKTGLDYSDYLDIFRFDNMLDYHKYNYINMTDDDVLNELKEERGADDGRK